MNLSTLQQGRMGDIGALIAGSCLPLAFAPFSFSPIAIISLAILFLLWQSCSPLKAFWRGLLYGLGLFGAGVFWVTNSFYQFGGMSMIGALLLAFAFIFLMALYPALLGAVFNQFSLENQAIKLILVVPAGWALIEWLRGWLFTGFPWLSVGYSQIDTFLRGFAPLLGVYGVSWVTALSAGLIVYGKKIGLILLLVLWGGGALLSQIDWTQRALESIKVVLVQGNIPQDFKWLETYQVPTIERYFTLSAQHREADLIIWPETAIPLFLHEVPDVLARLQTERFHHQTDFITGIPVMHEDGQTYFNGVMSISAHPSFYYKRHLVPFGEYIPLQDILGNLLRLLEVPMSEFSAGKADQPNLSAVGQSIGISICYEDAFGALIRASLPEATLLVNVSNDAWFGDSVAPHQHLEIARMRALENGRYLLRVTNTGISAIIDAQGKIIAQTPQSEVTALSGTVSPYQGATPYTRFGDALIITCLFSLLVASYLGLYLKK